MSKMSVKKVTGVMILSLSFGVSAALMSPFGGVFAGRDGENGKDTQGSSENVTDNSNSWEISTQPAPYVSLGSELQSTVGNTVQTIVSEESQAPVIRQNAPFDDFSFDDFSFDDFQVPLMDTNANTVGANLDAQNVAAVAETLGQNFGPGSDVSGEFNNQIGNQAQNENTKTRKRGRSAELTQTGWDFREKIAQSVFGSDKKLVNKELVIRYGDGGIAELKKQGIQISDIPRIYKRSINLFYNNYSQYSEKLVPEMKRLFIRDLNKTLNP